MLCENANFSSSCVSPIPPAEGRDWDQEKRLLADNWREGGKCVCVGGRGGLDIVLDVYKLLVLAGRMHYCLVRDANL